MPGTDSRPAPATVAALLAGLVATGGGGRPLVTFYDQATGERVELSVATYANWVTKAAGLLQDGCDLERGMTLRLDLPSHWLGPVFLGAAWTLGLTLTEAGAPDAVVCGPGTLPHWAPRAPATVVLACSLRPLGARFAEPVPEHVHDVGIEVWGQPDAFVALDPPGPDDPAAPGVTQRELLQRAAGGTLVARGGRLLSTINPATAAGWDTLLQPLLRGGSLVLVANPDPDRLNGLARVERTTSLAGAQPTRS